MIIMGHVYSGPEDFYLAEQGRELACCSNVLTLNLPPEGRD